MLALVALTGGVAVNALFMQSEKHPAPYFSARQSPSGKIETAAAQRAAVAPITTPITTPMPQPRPASLERTREAAEPARTPLATAPSAGRNAPQRSDAREPQAGGRPMQLASAPAAQRDQHDPIGALLAAGRPASASPPASIPKVSPQATNRIIAVQQALGKLGYRITADGVAGSGTRAAIEAFEKSRNIPVTGQISVRLARELSARSGVRIP